MKSGGGKERELMSSFARMKLQGNRVLFALVNYSHRDITNELYNLFWRVFIKESYVSANALENLRVDNPIIEMLSGYIGQLLALVSSSRWDISYYGVRGLLTLHQVWKYILGDAVTIQLFSDARSIESCKAIKLRSTRLESIVLNPNESDSITLAMMELVCMTYGVQYDGLITATKKVSKLLNSLERNNMIDIMEEFMFSPQPLVFLTAAVGDTVWAPAASLRTANPGADAMFNRLETANRYVTSLMH